PRVRHTASSGRFILRTSNAAAALHRSSSATPHALPRPSVLTRWTPRRHPHRDYLLLGNPRLLLGPPVGLRISGPRHCRNFRRCKDFLQKTREKHYGPANHRAPTSNRSRNRP